MASFGLTAPRGTASVQSLSHVELCILSDDKANIRKAIKTLSKKLDEKYKENIFNDTLISGLTDAEVKSSIYTVYTG